MTWVGLAELVRELSHETCDPVGNGNLMSIYETELGEWRNVNVGGVREFNLYIKSIGLDGDNSSKGE
jgi:hypothetical protein